MKKIAKNKISEKLKEILSSKHDNIGCFTKIKNNIFNNAKSLEYFELKDSKNAFNEYQQLLNSFYSKKVNQEKLIIAILRSTATALCYDLALLGYQALDLGHVMKSHMIIL